MPKLQFEKTTQAGKGGVDRNPRPPSELNVSKDGLLVGVLTKRTSMSEKLINTTMGSLAG